MAGLLQTDTSHTRSSLRPLLIGALVVAVLLAAAFGLFYHHENHAAVEVTGLRSITIPLHTVFTHTGKVLGPDAAEDSTYVVAAVRIVDRSDVPLFVKDITAGLTLADGSQVQATRIKATDSDRLFESVPAIRPAIAKIGVPPLKTDTTVPAKGTLDAYVMLQINGPESLWATRSHAELTLDFYHQDSVAVPLK